MKTTSRFAIATAFVAVASSGAMAADLGGNCCSDLEERIAELEATTARKGNRKVSLEVSGHVNEAVVFWKVDNNNGVNNERNAYIGTHNASRSRFRFKGSAKIDADWSAGFLMEFGVRRNSLVSDDQDISRRDAGIDIRHEALYIKSKRLGTVWLGHTSSAADGITEICLGCDLGGSSDWNDDIMSFKDGNGKRINQYGGVRGIFVGEGDRREIVRYISPELAGFVFSSSTGGDDFWDVSLRYANEFNGVRIAGGIAYQRSKDELDAGGLRCGHATGAGQNLSARGVDCEALGASASVMHVASGLYLFGAYGREKDKSSFDLGKDHSWQVTAGIKRKWSPFGATNFWGMYGRGNRGIDDLSAAYTVTAENKNLRYWGVGGTQYIDAAAMEIYLWYKHFDYKDKITPAFGGEMHEVVLGSRIRF